MAKPPNYHIQPMETPGGGKGKITLAMVVGVGVATALGMFIPQEESGRKVEATVAPAGELHIRHISGRQYLKVYLDMVGVPTACDGIITWRGKPLPQGKIFTEAECAAMLEEELVKHASAVMACTPGLALSADPATERRREGPRFAAVSGAYNFGPGLYCSSTARARFNAGDYPGGCSALTRFNKVRVSNSQVSGYRARGQTCTRSGKGAWYCTVRGLTDRRSREAKVCREGLGAL